MGFRQQIGDIWKHITQRTLEPRQWVMMVYRKFASGKILHFLHHYSVPGYVGVRWDEVLKSFFKEIFSGDTNQRAKSLSFSFLVAFPPMLVFLMTLIAYLPLDGVQDEFLHNLSDVLPRKIYATVADTVNDIMGNKRENLQFLGFVFSVWPAASGLNSLVRSFRNPKVEAKTRPWILRMTMSVGMVLVLYVLIILALVLMMEYHHLVDLLTDQGVIRWSENLRQAVGIGRWLVLAIALLIVINLMYFLIDYYWMKSNHHLGDVPAVHMGIRDISRQLQQLQPALRLDRNPAGDLYVDIPQLPNAVGRLRTQPQHPRSQERQRAALQQLERASIHHGEKVSPFQKD